jgi:hypothetical protein
MNKLKKNSRFSSLVENGIPSNIYNKDKKSTLLNEEKTKADANSFKNSRYHDRTFKEDRNKIDERRVKDTLSIENFPELVAPKSVTLKNTNIDKSFSEKLQSVVENKETVASIETDYKHLRQGWTLMKKENNKITIKSKDLFSATQNKTERDLANEALDTLVELHENRTHNYIEMWGYEQWEKMFEFPNYDYSYFDKLDELYYEEMAIDDEESEFEDDYDDSFADYDTYN